jgi:hypothetical protein
MINSDSFVVCLRLECKESGIIKKNLNKCSECKKTLNNLNLNLLNKYFCPFGKHCINNSVNCHLLHNNKTHQSPPYISPCINGIKCVINNCLFLHPNKFGVWLS